MNITIFTDGSSRGNPGPGGWGAVIVENDASAKSASKVGTKIVELGGGEKKTTNNRMELMAVAQALTLIKTDAQIDIYTDSSYLINGITKWIFGWKRNGWKTKTKEDVLNKDLWVQIYDLLTPNIKWHRIGGHVGVVGNERCDEIATAFADGEKIKLYRGVLAKYSLKNILDISHDAEKVAEKSSTSKRSRAKAYSYVSKVDGVIQIHKTWAECERRVKGVAGAKYRKALNDAEEREIAASL